MTAVNSLRTLGKPQRLDLWASTGVPMPMPRAIVAGQRKAPRANPRRFSSTSVELGELVADVAEDVRDQRAKEQQRHDHDDRDEGEKQTVLNEGLTFLIGALETSQKSADEVLIMCLGTSFPRRFAAEAYEVAHTATKWPNGPPSLGGGGTLRRAAAPCQAGLAEAKRGSRPLRDGFPGTGGGDPGDRSVTIGHRLDEGRPGYPRRRGRDLRRRHCVTNETPVLPTPGLPPLFGRFVGND